MNNKRSQIFLSILFLLPTCLLVYQVFAKTITKENYKQSISNIKSIENINSSSNSKNTLKQNNSHNYQTNQVNKSTDIQENISQNEQINESNSIQEGNSQNKQVNENIEILEDYTSSILDSSNLSQNTLKSISINSYKSNLETSPYIVKQGDTVSNILRNFEDTCNYKTAITHLKLFNSNIDLNEIEINSTINIPTTALKEGLLYKVISGDTWYKLAKSNYPEYNIDDIIVFLIAINDLPNDDLPLGENIFLPKL